MAAVVLRVDVWFSYVASKANIADLPSRGELGAMAAVLSAASPGFSLKRDRADLVLPVCFPDPASAWSATLAHLGVPAPRPASAQARGSRGSASAKRRR